MITGYKGFSFHTYKRELYCQPKLSKREFIYKVGKTYKTEGPLSVCNRGFHFCKQFRKVLNYYPLHDGTFYGKVTALGKVENFDNKSATLHLKVNKLLTYIEVMKELKRKEIPSMAFKNADTSYLFGVEHSFFNTPQLLNKYYDNDINYFSGKVFRVRMYAPKEWYEKSNKTYYLKYAVITNVTKRKI